MNHSGDNKESCGHFHTILDARLQCFRQDVLLRRRLPRSLQVSQGFGDPRPPPVSLHQVFILLKTFSVHLPLKLFTNFFLFTSFHRPLVSVDVEVRGSFMADFICRSFDSGSDHENDSDDEFCIVIYL